ncbi:MAG: branched-chain amino acid ABC transporter substrate-binding protein [Phycisphaerales bacterium]|nr:branched-chain amino acid ABC transporter substrate-binding protein [Phycisphaerales bacterium]
MSPTIPSVLSAACLLLFPCSGTAQELKIVSSLPRTGNANGQTTSMVNGIRMAIEEVGGHVDGYTILYEDMDDASPQRGNWDPMIEASNAEKAAANPLVVAYIGTFNSGAAKISMPILNKAGLAMVSPANTYPGLTKPGLGEKNEPKAYRPTGTINYFRIVPTDDLQGAVAADWAKELGAKKVFVLNDRELYGVGIANVFVASCAKLGIKVLGNEGVDTKAPNYRSLVTKIKALGADLVYYGGTTQNNAGQIAKDLRGGGVRVPFMVPDGCFEEAFIEAAGAENLNDTTYITFGGLPADQLTGKGAQFAKSYMEKFGTEPEAYAVYGYEAASVVLDALKRAKSKDRSGVLAALKETRDFHGAIGSWSFDENGDTTNRTMSGQTVRDGEFVFVKALGAESPKDSTNSEPKIDPLNSTKGS